MKKICILLAFISLLSCCFVGCKKEPQNTTPTQNSTTVQTTPKIEEKKLSLNDIEKAAQETARADIKRTLLNPNSYTENSIWGMTRKLIVTTSSGEEVKRIYISVYVDYSAQNRSGGYNRENESYYYYCSIDTLEMPATTSRYSMGLKEIGISAYSEAIENGKEF